MSTIRARLGMRGDLRVRVIRAHPTRRQRFADWLASVLRRF